MNLSQMLVKMKEFALFAQNNWIFPSSLMKNSDSVAGYRFSDTVSASKISGPFRGWAGKGDFFSKLLERSRLAGDEIESLFFGVFLQLLQASARGRRFPLSLIHI